MVQLTGTFTRLDGTPASGSVKITPSRSPIMDSTGQVVISGPQVFPLDKEGKIAVPIPASNDPDLGAPFTYSVQVVLDHALWKISKVWIPYGSTTVDLSEVSDFEPTPGVATRVVTIPADGEDGQVLVWDGAGFAWDDPPRGQQGPPGEVTTAALTTALAGKVTGAGMSVRVDTTVGTRVLLDHPGGTTMLSGDTGWRDMSSYFPTGMTGTFQARRLLHATDVKIDVTLTADSTLIGTVRTPTTTLIPGLPARIFPITSPIIAPLLMREGSTGAPTGTVMTSYMSPTATHLRVTSSRAGTWAVGDTIKISGTLPNDQPWPEDLPGTPA